MKRKSIMCVYDTGGGLYTHSRYNHIFINPRSDLWSTIQTDEVNELCLGPINRKIKKGKMCFTMMDRLLFMESLN